MNTPLTNVTPQQLRRAADIKERIDTLQIELNRMLGGLAQAGDGAAPRAKRKFSALARARMRTAQRARWAAIKGSKSPAQSVRKGKRKLSAAGRAALSLAAKARWRIARSKGKTTL